MNVQVSVNLAKLKFHNNHFRQQLIHDFRVQFNSVAEDMRFDFDCVAELGTTLSFTYV